MREPAAFGYTTLVKFSFFRGHLMSIREENKLFIREMRRLLDDYERSPHHIKSDIMEDVKLLIHALNENDRYCL